MRDFSQTTLTALARKGIRLVGLQACPDMTSGSPDWANATRSYRVDDNGCGRVWSFQEVLAHA